jgi:predicted nucleic acid-binding protein
LDTNVYLSFFHLSSDDLDELEKLILVIKNAEVRLFLPEQTRDEFNRNREIKIADALKRFNEEKLIKVFPQFSKSYKEYTALRKAITDYEMHKSELYDAMLKDISTQELTADKVIRTLFRRAQLIKTTPDIIQMAKERFDLGRPPGKNKSYGDAINWHSLLQEVPAEEDLYFISDDKDFFSEIIPDNFNSYLLQEWEEVKGSNIFSYRKISYFFKQKFPKIEIASEYEKELAVEALVKSNSFAATRGALAYLNTYDYFTHGQLQEMLKAFNDNNQIYWKSTDDDVKTFIKKWFLPMQAIFEVEAWKEFEKHYLKEE